MGNQTPANPGRQRRISVRQEFGFYSQAAVGDLDHTARQTVMHVKQAKRLAGIIDNEKRRDFVRTHQG